MVEKELNLGDLVKVKKTTVFVRAGAMGLVTGKHYRRYDKRVGGCIPLITLYDVELIENEYTLDMPGSWCVRYNGEDLEVISKG